MYALTQTFIWYIKERRWIHILTKKSIRRGLKLRWDSKLVDAK